MTYFPDKKFSTSHPWEKPKEALTQFDWLTAVGLSGQHRTTPTDLRLAQELVRFSSNETMIAWPTTETLADYVGVHRVSVSKSIKSLKLSGALLVTPIGHLPDNLRSQIKRRGRGNAYCLNIAWAYEILSAKPFMRAPEPDHLKKARLKSQSNVADATTLPNKSNVATHATTIVTIPVTLDRNRDCYTNIETDIEGYRPEPRKEKNGQGTNSKPPTSKQVADVIKYATRAVELTQNRRVG